MLRSHLHRTVDRAPDQKTRWVLFSRAFQQYQASGELVGISLRFVDALTVQAHRSEIPSQKARPEVPSPAKYRRRMRPGVLLDLWAPHPHPDTRLHTPLLVKKYKTPTGEVVRLHPSRNKIEVWSALEMRPGSWTLTTCSWTLWLDGRAPTSTTTRTSTAAAATTTTTSRRRLRLGRRKPG